MSYLITDGNQNTLYKLCGLHFTFYVDDSERNLLQDVSDLCPIKMK